MSDSGGIGEVLAELAALRETVEQLRADMERLTTPQHGSNTVVGQNVKIDPTARLVSNQNATIRIGDHTSVWRGAEWVGPIRVGARVFINQGSYIRPGVVIEDEVSLGPFVRLISDTHDLSAGSRRTGTPRKLPITIGRGTWIGAGATVLGGVTIGERCLVAAGAVVTKDMPDNTLIAGVPARVVRLLHDTDGGVQMLPTQ